MDAARWQQINDLFHAVVDRDPGDRTAWLEAACEGDAELRAEVEALLEGDAAGNDKPFLQPIPHNVKSQLGVRGPDDQQISRRVGPYIVKRIIGRGGMGNVYLAARAEGFKQRVALKILKRGMDTDEVLRRFRTEVRVQAALSQHPFIVGLLDAGTTDDGLPFFAMEYVEGIPIHEYCDRHGFTIKERLRLFLSVCEAVQFAHQHAIIHRDLKPSNILITPDGTPRLIDFGIAKLTTPELGSETATPTRTDFRFLTPDYASPEQTRGEPITTSTDVFSLGVVLFELLTGAHPYPKEVRSRWAHLSPSGAESVRPSQCLMSAPAGSDSTPDERGSVMTEVASRRGTTLAKLKRELRGDLDNIVMMAIRVEPRRRYASVEQFADDVRAYLSAQPVVARPIGKVEKVWRWCQRNPMPAALGPAILLSALFGLWHLARLSEQLVRSTALEGAAQQAEMLQEVQDFYSENVVSRVHGAVTATHRYREQNGTIPVPATFTIDLGRDLDQRNGDGMSVSLYSNYPWRPNGGPRDDFQREAIDALQAHPKQPFYRFESKAGRTVLRYATARVMQQSCVDCHNSHPDSPKRDWKVGDVRGVLEVDHPVHNDAARMHATLRGTFLMMGTLAAVLLAVLFFALIV